MRKKERKSGSPIVGLPLQSVEKAQLQPDFFDRLEHKRQFAYEAHTACDKNGFVLETVVTPGNVHDSVAFDEVYDKVTENFPQVEAVVADAAYKTPHICKKVFDDGRVLSTAYKRPQTMKNGHEWWKYVYDEFYNCVICPEYQPLKYSTTAYAQLYKCRKETIDRVFADAKEKHAMRYTQYRGLAQVTNWVKLKFAAMNLKKLATWKWRDLLSSFRFAVFFAHICSRPSLLLSTDRVPRQTEGSCVSNRDAAPFLLISAA